MSAYQIKNNSKIEEVISKSKFIAFSFCVQNKAETDEILQKLKLEYKDSTHICYAYKLLSGEEKCSDDGEPQGTAGLPILDVVKKVGITNILVAVVRYFGGIKLGAGGLVRAYSGVASLVIEKSGIVEVAKCKKIVFNLPIYQNKQTKSIEKLDGIKKINLEYGEFIKIEVYVEFEKTETTKKQICNIFSNTIDFLEDEKFYYIGE